MSNGGAPSGLAAWMAPGQRPDLGRIDDVVQAKERYPGDAELVIRLAADAGSSLPAKAIIRRPKVTT